MTVIDAARTAMEAAGSEHTVMPSVELLPILTGCLNSRTGQWRRTKPTKGQRDGGSALLWTLFKFHGSNGDLWGYPHFADVQERESLDTIAIILHRGRSSAAEAWSRALGK